MNITECQIVIGQIPEDDHFDCSCLSYGLIEYAGKFSPVRRRQYLSCRILLSRLLGLDSLPEIVVSDNSRPIFRDPSLPDFSITHSQNMIMVALAGHQSPNQPQNQPQRIGLDLEVFRSRPPILKLAHYAFSDDEYQWLLSLPESERAASFWHLWTIRESILKLNAKGVWQMSQINISPTLKAIQTDLCERLSVYNFQHSVFGKNISWSISSYSKLKNLKIFQSTQNLDIINDLSLMNAGDGLQSEYHQ